MNEDFAGLRDEMIRTIDEVSTVEAVPECPCSDLRRKLMENRFNLVVVGQFKRGKTTFINALLGADLLPTAVVPLTSIVTVIEYGDSVTIKVFLNNGENKEIPLEELPLYVTESGNPRNKRDVAEVSIQYPSPYLREGVRLIDTPGVGSVYQHNTDVAYEYLPRSDAAVFLISVDQPLSKAELDFLKDVKQYSDRIFFIQNKADYLTPEDLKESLAFTGRVLQDEAGYETIEVYPLSARLGLEGKLNRDPAALEASRLTVFEERLHRFLVEEKGGILIRSAAKNLLKVLSEAILRAELEYKSMNTPLELIQKKLDTFEEKQREIEADKNDFEILLEGETKRIIEKILDPDLNAAKKDLAQGLGPAFEDFYARNRSLSPGKLRKALEEFVVHHVKEYDTVFRKNEDTKISMAFEKGCERFVTRINEIIDALLHYASDLFSVGFETFDAESLWTMKSSFYFIFKDEPIMVEILGNALTTMMPRFLSHPIIARSMRRYLAAMIEQQSGRIRWDFVERLQKSKLEVRWVMFAKIDETIQEIRNAVQRGIARKEKGKEEAAKRETEIRTDLDHLYALKERALRILDRSGRHPDPHHLGS
ncbi:MAG: dynamin [Nitrospirae bacterium CG_4_9_14_3_um_filter_53_35]|nr:MAG: dynamin [Nitrospirae bacterium CG_4_9_14_3_um_filter_53_35]